ncbi:hypothetical protein PENARI_c002G09576 [Penicillium arizonense]|uniref:Uncharacterized protein n=1 Tax=Penicillium arizonense TaxID=1835702 RepID=A0A1F5LV17_PENAI|nr:hypothetical protein PENARI_c002G09576 [Penicillium arizonense]OGE56990.1 hypothetical protein PENARI_c002G09576 [Penicillium arizonense]
MYVTRQVFILLPLFHSAAIAFPQQTGTVTAYATPAIITPAVALRCSDGQLAIYTTDCTLGTPVSYCSRPEPPMKCPQGFFSSVWHPDHCMEQPTCFPLNAAWITTECSNGALAYATSTLYEGTLAGGQSTIISGAYLLFLGSSSLYNYSPRQVKGQRNETSNWFLMTKAVSCSCAEDQWYSMTLLEGSTTYDTFCMPSSYCPLGMTTSVSFNDYCVTAPASACSGIPMETNFCKCSYAGQTPVYPEYPGAVPTRCEF